MSASQNHIPHNDNTPNLPPELWLQIFRFATWVPELNVFDTSSEREELVTTKWNRRRLKLALTTKRSLVRVCRQWCSLATPYLYEYIVIMRERVLPLLHRTLVESMQRAAGTEDGRPLGWWTRRLDVIVRWWAPRNHPLCPLLPDTIRCFHNLTTFKFVDATGIGRCIPEPVLLSLTDTCHHSLQVIIWPDVEPALDDWQLFIATASNLQVIHCPYALFQEDPELPILPALTSLLLDSDFFGEFQKDDITVNRFPNLREIVYDLGVTVPILRRFGHGLTRVVLRNALVDSQLLGQLTQFCPNLRRLDISLPMRPNLVLPPVTHLGMRRPAFHQYRQFFAALGTMKARALKVVQLTDDRTVADLRNHHARILAELIMLLKSRNLSLQDAEGHVLE